MSSTLYSSIDPIKRRNDLFFLKPDSGSAVEMRPDGPLQRLIASALLDMKDANSKALTPG